MGNAKAIVERGDELFNKRDVDGLLELYAPGAVFEGPGDMVAKGHAEIRRFIDGWLQGFPDCRLDVERHIVEGSTVVEIGVFRGTHTGVFPTPMGDIPPTGKHVDGSYIDIFDIDGDKVVRDRLVFDRMQLMEQLGLVPSAAGAAS